MPNSFTPPRFYPIIDTRALAATPFTPVQVAEEASAAGVRILQYRHKAIWTQVNYDDARALADICSRAGILFVVNDRADFAHLLGAGLHIGQDDLPPTAARKVVSNAIIGFSTHNSLQLKQASGVPADYLSIGPIFSTQSKQNPDPVVGLQKLAALRKSTAKPLVAIGGITIDQANQVLATGVDSVAIISGIIPVDHTRSALREQLQQWLRITNDAPKET